jgi:prepilin-type N-terminal cleavage/methylation domain-containing protein
LLFARPHVLSAARVNGRGGRHGFTLIELLVTIAILAILAALLLPVLSSAHRRAQALRCQSNLRQISVATVLYCQDNNDSLRFAWYDDNDPSHNNSFSLLTPLLYRSEFDGYGDFESLVYACPKRLKEPLVGENPMRISYGMNAYNSVDFPDPRTRRLAQMANPAATLMIADIAFGFNHPPPSKGLMPARSDTNMPQRRTLCSSTGTPPPPPPLPSCKPCKPMLWS